jgi:hypothetical protein
MSTAKPLKLEPAGGAPMSIEAIVATLRAVTPEHAFRVRLPVEIVLYIEPFHAALMNARTRQARRRAWREWDAMVRKLERDMRAVALATN